jgi:hypothetical protein
LAACQPVAEKPRQAVRIVGVLAGGRHE